MMQLWEWSDDDNCYHDYDYDMIVLMKLSGWSEDGYEMCGCKSADEDIDDNDDNDDDDDNDNDENDDEYDE